MNQGVCGGVGRSEQAVVGGVGQCLGDALGGEFLENLAAVVLHGVGAAAEAVGYLLDGVALGGKHEHLFLLGAQGHVGIRLPAVGFGRVDALAGGAELAELDVSGLLVG